MATPKFYNKDGSLTLYALSCGYVQRDEKGIRYKILFMEHSHLHIQWGIHGEYRSGWETFENNELTKARKFFKDINLDSLVSTRPQKRHHTQIGHPFS